MPKVFYNLAVPAADGVGASQAVALLGRDKTIIVGGILIGPTLTIEFSHDNSTWLPLESFSKPGEKTVELACGWVRVRIQGYLAGTGMVLAANVDIGGVDDGTQILNLPATAGDGTGASIDIAALGSFLTVAVTGTFTGVTHVEYSQDNTDWHPIQSFDHLGHHSQVLVTRYMRVRRTGNSGGTPTVYVAAANDYITVSSGGGNLYAPPEQWHQENVAAGQTAVDLSALVSISFDAIKMIRAGSIVGLATRLTEAITDDTNNSLIVRVTINGNPGTLFIAHRQGVNALGGIATQAPGIDPFVAGDLIGVELTTLQSFAPTTTDLEAWLDLEV